MDSLLRSARRAEQACQAALGSGDGGGGGGWAQRPLVLLLGRFLDEMAIESHEAEQGGGGDSGGGSGTCAGAVLVTTIHQAKGLEWEEVYMPGMTEGSLPLRPASLLPNSLEEVEHIEEERRLAYVGFTRARGCLHLSWAERAADAGGAWGGGAVGGRPKPSRFLPPAVPALSSHVLHLPG